MVMTKVQTAFVTRRAVYVREVLWMLWMKNKWKISSATHRGHRHRLRQSQRIAFVDRIAEDAEDCRQKQHRHQNDMPDQAARKDRRIANARDMVLVSLASARLNAGASCTPSPVTATDRPCAYSAVTRRNFCSGLVRAKVSTSVTSSASSAPPIGSLPTVPTFFAVKCGVVAQRRRPDAPCKVTGGCNGACRRVSPAIIVERAIRWLCCGLRVFVRQVCCTI